MTLIDNRLWLTKYNRDLLKVLDVKGQEVAVEPSKEQLPTLKIKLNGKQQYVHSKYRPSQDVERLLKSYEDNRTIPVLFWGSGLGYHIDAFVERYPNRKFAIYEPNEAVFTEYVRRSNLHKYRTVDVIDIQVGLNHYESKMREILQKGKGKIQIIALPVYEKAYRSKLGYLYEQLVETLEFQKDGMQAELGFQLRWTLNTVKNFPVVLQTPNFLKNNGEDIENNDVAIIVSAGPSLNEEYDNLRTILKKNLAYVLAVGSAINALLEESIKPHAFVSYDPKITNHQVSEKIKKRNIKDIPLVFGSCIGYETLESYPGDLYHFHTNQDYLSPYLLGEDIPAVNDAPSIAVITLQILLKLGFKKIVFVGQNLAFLDEYRHAKGIDYEGYQPKITKGERIIYTKNVEDIEIKTDENFESMRQQLEMYIAYGLQMNPEIEFINTTRGGAAIQGTSYKPLSTLIDEEYFVEVSPEKLFDSKVHYDKKKMKVALKSLEEDYRALPKQIEDTFQQLKKLQKIVELKKSKQVEPLLGKFDEVFAQVENNDYYNVLLKSMLRVQFDQLAEAIAVIKYESNVLQKAQVILISFNTYLNYILEANRFIEPSYLEMVERIEKGE